MHSSIESEVHLHVPLQIVHDRPHATDLFHGRWLVCHIIGENIPMPRRGFGTGAIGPELRAGAREIAAFNYIGGVRKPGDGISRTAMSIVDVEVAVAIVARIIEAGVGP